jgi:hypothetical protein
MTAQTNHFSKADRNVDVYEHIMLALKGIQFGSVEIIIHDGKIVQVERREKIRFENRSSSKT